MYWLIIPDYPFNWKERVIPFAQSCQVHDPPVSVFKGYCLPKEAEEFLMSRGLKNASYTVDAADLKNNIFGHLVHCPDQVR